MSTQYPQDDRLTPQYGGQPPWQPANTNPPKRKRHIGRWILGLVLLLAFGGCALIAVAGSNSINDSIKAPVSTQDTTQSGAPKLTTGQEQAVGAAKNYLETAGFSRLGLIRQLSSKAGDGYSTADATYAVDHIKVDWNAQAVRAAKAYLDTSNFSRAGLIQQLTSSAGDQFTVAQATYAATQVGLK